MKADFWRQLDALMMKKTITKKAFFIFILIPVFLCTPPLTINSKTSPKKNLAELRKYNDSINAIFQKKSYHPKRTIQYIKPVLDSLSIQINHTLNDSLVKHKIRGKSMTFSVLPSGRFRFNYFADFPKSDQKTYNDPKLILAYFQSDSGLNRLIDSVTKKIRTDSILNYKPYLLIKGVISSGLNGLSFAFKDTSYYTRGMTGGRSRASIMKKVMEGLPQLTKAYNIKLWRRPRLEGKITVKFAIYESGDVFFSEVIPSATTIGNPDLEKEFTEIILHWQFEKINNPGDVTEVVYPFILSR